MQILNQDERIEKVDDRWLEVYNGLLRQMQEENVFPSEWSDEGVASRLCDLASQYGGLLERIALSIENIERMINDKRNG